MQLKDLLREFDEVFVVENRIISSPLSADSVKSYITRSFEAGEQKGREESKVDDFYGVSVIEYEVIVGKARRTVLDEAIREVEKYIDNCEKAIEAGGMSQFGSASGSMMAESALSAFEDLVKILNKMKG